MIACNTGTHAAYVLNGITSYLPVEAWDREGNPMVAGDRGLVHADEYRALGLFAYLESAQAVQEARAHEAEGDRPGARPIASGTVLPRLAIAA